MLISPLPTSSKTSPKTTSSAPNFLSVVDPAAESWPMSLSAFSFSMTVRSRGRFRRSRILKVPFCASASSNSYVRLRVTSFVAPSRVAKSHTTTVLPYETNASITFTSRTARCFAINWFSSGLAGRQGHVSSDREFRRADRTVGFLQFDPLIPVRRRDFDRDDGSGATQDPSFASINTDRRYFRRCRDHETHAICAVRGACCYWDLVFYRRSS